MKFKMCNQQRKPVKPKATVLKLSMNKLIIIKTGDPTDKLRKTRGRHKLLTPEMKNGVSLQTYQH